MKTVSGARGTAAAPPRAVHDELAREGMSTYIAASRRICAGVVCQ